MINPFPSISFVLELQNRQEKFRFCFFVHVSCILWSSHCERHSLRNLLFAKYATISSLLTIWLSVCSTYFMWTLYVELSVIWLLFQVFLLFVCPFILIIKQKSKQTIHGPWDEAIPRKNSWDCNPIALLMVPLALQLADILKVWVVLICDSNDL